MDDEQMSFAELLRGTKEIIVKREAGPQANILRINNPYQKSPRPIKLNWLYFTGSFWMVLNGYSIRLGSRRSEICIRAA